MSEPGRPGVSMDAEVQEKRLDLESLFKLSYAMCIAGSVKDGKLNGCTVNSVFQVAPDPPMVVLSLNREALTHEFITHSGVFAASILSEGAAMPLIGKFGFRTGRDIDKFEGVPYRLGRTGAPILLADTAAFLEAEVTDRIEVVTHTLFVGRIVACETLDEKAHTMTYTFYRDVKHGRTPRSAATYVGIRPQRSERKGQMKKYVCRLCGYVYDPQVGDPENGVPPGTAFEALPDDWICPDCGVSKDEFDPAKE